MEELRNFFNNPGPSGGQMRKLRGPLTGGVRLTKEDPSNVLTRKEEHRHTIMQTGTAYAHDVIQREAEMYRESEISRQERANIDSLASGLESLEKLSSFGTSAVNIQELTNEAMTAVYNKYSFQIKEGNNNLGINTSRQQILDLIRAYPVLIIEGPTGCGKTTQVPQWILDDSYNNRKPCRIIVTQPRRIAAISIAKRVAQERGWDVGGLVGYQVALENHTSADTRISYVTTGVLLQKLVAAKNMNEYTHIILDEVHERGQEMDFLLIVVKRLLFTVSPNVKVVLMSATFNTNVFLDYFKIPTPLGLQASSCIEVGKQEKMFTVKIFYLNQLNKLHMTSQLTEKDEATIKPEMYHLAVKLVNAFEGIDKLEEEFPDLSVAEFPSVLIFLPGINEIEELFSCLTDFTLRAKIDSQCPKYKWWVLPLHSTITAEEQVRVFQRAPPGHRKIILATNIAESSITVPDIKYVVDFCLMKQLVADKNTNFTSLQLTWASKANCEQRAGRAGRVRDGRVYRLVTDKFYENFSQECTPEILRCPLERLVLLSKTLNMGPPSDILALAMNPPELHNIHRTVLVLKEMGALTRLIDDQWVPTDGEMTYMGRIMAKLPIDVRLSKLIVLGHIFGCLEECIIMAAAMSVKNIFSSPFGERLNAYNSKLTWADGCTSDCITFLNVYKVWNHLRRQQAFKQKGTGEVQWARRFYVQVRALRELDEMVRELKTRLSREGIEVTKFPSPWTKNHLPLALKVIIAGAFYPQYFVQVSHDEGRERDAVKTLSGLDPRNTVYLKNFPEGQPGIVYASKIKDIIRQKIGDEPRVTFDKNSRKVFLTFDENSYSKRDKESGNPSIPGQVVLPVYKSVKARQLRIDIRIPLLEPQEAQSLADTMEEEISKTDIEKLVPRLPQIEDTLFPIKITHKMSAFKFYARYHDQSTEMELASIQQCLNQRPLLALAAEPRPGELVAAPSGILQAICRARLHHADPHSNQVQVFYIDFGHHGRINKSNLRELPQGVCTSVPPLALQCSLAGVAPSLLLDQKAQPPQIIDRADTAKVYSVVHGVVNLELLADNGRININQELVRKGFAIPCEESYESKMNHDVRESAYTLSMAQQRGYNREQTEHAFQRLLERPAPAYTHAVADAHLQGPYSPLETVLHNLMYANREKLVAIEWNSVNSVLLDTEPQEVYERLLVAGEVGQNELSSKLTLRHTTLMPNIPGLPAILGLLFSPQAELRRDSTATRYVSCLCGLGADDDGRPYFPEHDLLFNVDADLPIEHVGTINHVRYLMDFMMSETYDDEIAKNVPKCIRDHIIELFTSRRKHYEPESVPNAWEWKSVPAHELLEISSPELEAADAVFPLHAPQELFPVSRDQLLQLKRENDLLKMTVARNPTGMPNDLVCKLCNTAPLTAQQMRLHLYSNTHKEKEEDFRIFDS